MELDTQGKMISVFRVGLKHKQNKTHRVSHWMDRKKLRQDADFPALSRVLWFCSWPEPASSFSWRERKE